VSHSFVERDARVNRQIATLRERGWMLEVLALDPKREEPALRTWRFPFARRRGSALRYVFEYGMFFVWTLLWTAWRSWRRQRPAAVYINSLPDFLVFAALPARIRRIPIILDVHDPMPELFHAKGRSSQFVWRLLVFQEQASLRFADRVLTVHEPMQELLRSRSPSIPVDIVMNMPDIAHWEPLIPDPDSRMIVYTGSIAVRYGLDDLIEAIGQVSEEIPGIRLRLVGEGEDIDELLGIARRLGIQERIEFVGKVPWRDIRKQLDGVWAGFNGPKPHPAGNLSFSNKVVEWVHLRLPVIASGIPTLRRYFPETALWFFEPGSVDSLATTLRRLDAAPRESIDAALDRAQQAVAPLRWDVQRDRLVSIVDEAVARGRLRH
jgi:glycosyltransferase involved in cell wall biosynthesis